MLTYVTKLTYFGFLSYFDTCPSRLTYLGVNLLRPLDIRWVFKLTLRYEIRVNLPYECYDRKKEIIACFGALQGMAASSLGLSLTAFKQIYRKLDIKCWQYTRPCKKKEGQADDETLSIMTSMQQGRQCHRRQQHQPLRLLHMYTKMTIASEPSPSPRLRWALSLTETRVSWLSHPPTPTARASRQRFTEFKSQDATAPSHDAHLSRQNTAVCTPQG